MIKYSDYKQNHVVLPGREKELENFLNSTYKGVNHKRKNSYSSNSEDALTWSCFDIISQLSDINKIIALDEILKHSFIENNNMNHVPFSFTAEKDIVIEVGKTYIGPNIKEETEVDAIIRTSKKIIFIEAKLYSSITLCDKDKRFDQIAKKIRVGLDYAISESSDFYFILLDIAPREKLFAFTNEKICKSNAMKHPTSKWKSAWWFNRYKNGWRGNLSPLKEALAGIDLRSGTIDSVSKNMGWLTWADLFKITMRGLINNFVMIG